MKQVLISFFILVFGASIKAQDYYLVYTRPSVDKLEYQFTDQNSLVYSAYRYTENKKSFFFETGLETPETVTQLPNNWIDLNSVSATTNFVNAINTHALKLHILTPSSNGFLSNPVGAARLIESTDDGFFYNDATSEFNFNPNQNNTTTDISIPQPLEVAKAAIFFTEKIQACQSDAYFFKSVPLQACVSEFQVLIHPHWGVIRETNGNGENKNFELVRINGGDVCPYINNVNRTAFASVASVEKPEVKIPAVPRAYSTEVVRSKTTADTNFPNEFNPNGFDSKSNEFQSMDQPCNVVPNSNEYVVKQGDNLNTIARQYNLTVNGLKSLNQLSSDIIFPCTKLIVVANNIYGAPADNMSNQTNIPTQYNVEVVNNKPLSNNLSTNPCNIQLLEGEHLVKNGETLPEIAAMYNTTVNALVELNNLNSDELAPCYILKIPAQQTVTSTQPTESLALPSNYSVEVVKRKPGETNVYASKAPVINCNTKARSNEYVVQSGDNVFSIARSYGIPAHQILVLNKLKTNTIHPCEVLKIAADPKVISKGVVKPVRSSPDKKMVKGQKLKGKTPSKTPQTVAENNTASPNVIIRKGSGIYIVRKGESVKDLTSRFNVSDLEFRKMNNLNATEELLAGQVVRTELCNCANDMGPVPLAYNVKSVKLKSFSDENLTSVDSSAVALQNRKYHVVGEKETLYSISKKYAVPLQKLRELNNLNEADVISVKQVLVVK